MRRNDRLLGPLLTIVVLAAPPLITGCATHETYYDADYRDYHRWNGDEVTLYIQWEGVTHRDHREFRDRPREEQQQYWNWRHHSNDRDHDHDRDHDRDHN